MALDNNPHCFRFEGRLWVSEIEPEEAARQFAAQRAWDAASVKSQRWIPAVVIGAIVGVGAVIALSTAAGLPIALSLFTLPVGFAIGAVLGAVVNKRLLGADAAVSGDRPTMIAVTRVPHSVARKAPEDATAAEIIDWSKKGFVPKELLS